MGDDTIDKAVIEGALSMALGNARLFKQAALDIWEPRQNRTIDEMVQRVTFGAAVEGPRRGFDSVGLAQELVPFTGALFMWARDGFPHFSLSPDFFGAIAVTDFGDPSDEPLYMPFDSFTLSFPQNDYFGGATRAFVYKLPSVDGPMNPTSPTEFTVAWKMYRATLLTDDPVFTQWGIGMTRKELAEKEEWLNATPSTPGVRPIEDDEKPLVERLRTLLANILSYVEAAGPLPTERRQKGAAPLPVERVHAVQPNFDVGRPVKLHPGIRAAIAASKGSKAAWKVAQRFIVRGHWRLQAHGPARSLRTRKWIEPFFKGPENVAEALQRTYEVE